MSISGCEVGVEGKPAGAWAAVVGGPAVEVAAWTPRTELLREPLGQGQVRNKEGEKLPTWVMGPTLGRKAAARRWWRGWAVWGCQK